MSNQVHSVGFFIELFALIEPKKSINCEEYWNEIGFNFVDEKRSFEFILTPLSLIFENNIVSRRLLLETVRRGQFLARVITDAWLFLKPMKQNDFKRKGYLNK